ncbi:cell division protein FtsA, partial [bacterium]|nr:cell division protein FtsA [bacterium]
AIIGEADSEGKISILGMGSCPSKGLRCGEITELQPTIDAIDRATQRAVEVANVSIGDIYVGIAGDHLQSRNNDAVVEIRHPARGIDEKDRQRVIQKATEISLPADQALVQYVVQEFQINGGKTTPNPIGLSGSNLKVSTHLVTGCVDALQNIMKCVRRAGFAHPNVVLQSLASSMSVIGSHEQELGVVLVDIGGGTTDVAISFDGAVRATGEIAMGGDYITRDIAEVLPCRLNDAENIKKRQGCALPEMVERGRTFQLPSPGNPTELITHDEYNLAEIIESRLEDVFGLVRRFVERSGYRDRLHAGLVLTGGTALLPGITDVAERILEMKCRVGAPQGLKGFTNIVTSPIYSTGVGLIMYGFEQDRQNSRRRSGWRRVLDYLDETFA